MTFVRRLTAGKYDTVEITPGGFDLYIVPDPHTMLLEAGESFSPVALVKIR